MEAVKRVVVSGSENKNKDGGVAKFITRELNNTIGAQIT